MQRTPKKKRGNPLDLSRRPLLAVAVSAALSAVTQPAAALPQGGQVVQGNAAIRTQPQRMTIRQNSSRAIINWQAFSIGAGEKVRIHQPSATSAILNRVTGTDLSAIMGRLQSNGQVYLLNPNGIVVGPSGRIDTAGFIGSTLRTSDDEFMRGGKVNLQGPSSAGIVNLGSITATNGDVVLIAARADNRGSIAAPNGTAALVAGSKLVYAPSDGEILIEAAAPATGTFAAVNNTGLIAAAKAELKAAGNAYALAVNNGGQVSATAVREVGGQVIVDAGAGDAVSSGTLVAIRGDKGGAIDVLGGRVSLAGPALLDASGPAGGGVVRIGGGWHGTDASVANARTTTVGVDALIRANATASGNGGSVVVWSDEATAFGGRIEAKGGPLGGNGGSAEVSGRTLAYAGRADTTAPKGRTGSLLLDPTDLDIDGTEAGIVVANLAATNVAESATNSITVSAPISNPTTTNTLTLDAPTVAVNANISLPNGFLDFGTSGVAGTSVTSSAASSLTALTVDVQGNFQTVDLAGPVTATTFGYTPINSTLASLSVKNAANAFPNLSLTNGTVSLTGNVDVRSSGQLLVAGKLTTAGNLTMVATGGDLAFGGGGPTLNVDGVTTLASTTGVFNDNGSLALGGTGRKILYSSSDSGAFNVTGLPYTQVNPVGFGSDPQGAGNVIYIQTASGLPLLTISADNKGINYGAADPAFTATLSGGTASAFTTAPQFQVGGAHSNVGTYAITPFGATSSTFRLSFVDGTLTISPATLTITANNASREYGSANPGFTTSAGALFNGDTLAAVVPNLAVSSTALLTSGVGAYPITPTGTSASGNYTLQLVGGTLSVTPASLLVTANDATRSYGTANPAFTPRFSGLLNGDTGAAVTGLVFSTAATQASPVSAYEIVPSGGSASNYRLSYANGALSITKVPLTITTSSASVVYGNAVPLLNDTYTGLVAGDTPATVGVGYATSVVPGTSVGTYPTTLSGPSQNYVITYTPGTLSVTPRPLTIAADDMTRFLNVPNPNFTATVTGLFGADTIDALQLTTTASTSSPLGTYPINASSGAMPNYAVTYKNGTLKVASNPLGDLLLTVQNPNLLTSYKPQTIDLFATTTSNVIVIAPAFLGSTDPGVLAEQKKVVGRFVDAMNKAGAKISDYDVNKALTGDQATRDAMLGTLLPFIFQELTDILALDAAKRTPEEAAYLATVEKYIQDQKTAAADEGMRQFQAWMAAETKKVQDSATGIGVAGVYMNMIEAANPEGPPPDFLNQAQAGMVLTNGQLKSYVAVNDQVAKMGEQAKAEAKALDTDQVKQAVARMEADRLADLTLKPGLSTDQRSALMDKYNQAVADFYSTDPAKKAQADKALDALYKEYNLPIIGALEVSSVVATAGSSSGLNVGELPGAIADAGRVLILANYLSGGGLDATKIVGQGSEVVDKLFQGALRLKEGLAHRAKLDRFLDFMTGEDIGEEVVSAGSKIAKVAETAGEVLAVGGVILEVVGNAVQIGIGVAGYASIGVYENQIIDAQNKARTAVTASDLKSMDSNTLYSYVNAMLVTSGQVGAK